MSNPFSTLETLAVRFEGMVAHVTLNRAEAKNAMNFQMVADLYTVFTGLRGNRDVRAILLRGAGGTFCSGGDIKEMRAQSVPDAESRVNLDAMLRAANQAEQVVVACIEGAALGGGFGLACVSDIAIAEANAVFGLPEVRLGIAPAYISPFVIQRVGFTRARELMLTGRRFKGEEARAYGIAHHVAPAEGLQAQIEAVLADLRQCAPSAIASTKALMFEVADKPLDDTVAYRADLLNRLRQGEEAQEGMRAFLEKRAPRWASDDAS
ncbi:MAG: enoyl-CoA hydratase-related protein [Anaerolineae bacterium]|nr:enoyl-CoA hydratase-related protein [Anaerolineae bacterium]MDW8173932.1 enoyl-CoA hydratase-related protein [Anaerolineae bacterium]